MILQTELEFDTMFDGDNWYDQTEQSAASLYSKSFVFCMVIVIHCLAIAPKVFFVLFPSECTVPGDSSLEQSTEILS